MCCTKAVPCFSSYDIRDIALPLLPPVDKMTVPTKPNVCIECGGTGSGSAPLRRDVLFLISRLFSREVQPGFLKFHPNRLIGLATVSSVNVLVLDSYDMQFQTI
ncbi:hypothetical protein CSKR_109890 [Clonorchis sinensis]|uniref:Uncharacterized protein n=1 Tax=Clonorchis sinensis TaxID=79923 RepID=A0A3R7G877_CLOSI|nr:hypothetical protein CSKR_109890 [Clonorchis sinensis]